jgi:hypothetical protein
MAGVLGQLALRSANSASALLARLAPAAVCTSESAFSHATSRAYAAVGEPFTRKDVIYNLDNPDPEAEASIKAFLKAQYAAAAKGPLPPPPAEPELELTQKIERKYVAAEIVETGIQSIAVPLSSDSTTPLKRYLAQLHITGKQAGFEELDAELSHKLKEAAGTTTSVRAFLQKAWPYASPEFHAALVDALTAVEANTEAPITFESPEYAKFTERVKALAQQHKLPWQMLLSYKTRLAGANEEAADGLKKDYAAWLQNAQLADVKAELEDLKAEAVKLLDGHLSKSADAVRKEQQAALNALTRKLEAARGTKWAAKYQQDLQYLQWFDAKVAENPASGPRPSA